VSGARSLPPTSSYSSVQLDGSGLGTLPEPGTLRRRPTPLSQQSPHEMGLGEPGAAGRHVVHGHGEDVLLVRGQRAELELDEAQRLSVAAVHREPDLTKSGEIQRIEFLGDGLGFTRHGHNIYRLATPSQPSGVPTGGHSQDRGMECPGLHRVENRREQTAGELAASGEGQARHHAPLAACATVIVRRSPLR
jgi:hypothetical protein